MAIVILAFSCIDDEGSYNYDYIDTIEVPNIHEDTTYSYKYGSNIVIEPNIVTDMDENDMSFLWLSDMGGVRYDTLSYERNLNISAELATAYLEFRILHKPSGVQYKFTTIMEVSEPFTIGWGILSNTDEAAIFNFMSGADEVSWGEPIWEYIENPYFSTNGEQLPKLAKDLVFGSNDRLWVVKYEDDGVCFNFKSMLKSQNISEYFSSMEYVKPPFSPDYIGFTSSQANNKHRFVTSGGDLFPVNNIGYNESYSLVTPIEGEHYISDKIGYINQSNYLVFDDAAKRYLWVNIDAVRIMSYPPVKLAGSADAENVDISNLNMDCIWMEAPMWSRKAYSILKDNAGDYYLQIMKCNSGTVKFEKNTKLDAGIIKENSKFTVTSDGGMYIATDNIIHRYNGSNDVFIYNWLELDADILAMNVYDEYPYNELGVAVVDGENSIFTIYDLNESNPDERVSVTQNVDGHVKQLSRIYW